MTRLVRKLREKKDFVDLNTALSADIVTFHTPLTFSGSHPTHNLLGGHNFELITQNTIVINTARGGIIDEDLWLKTETKANVIDCWEEEPNINTNLQKFGLLGNSSHCRAFNRC